MGTLIAVINVLAIGSFEPGLVSARIRGSIVRQNRWADQYRLERFRNRAHLRWAIRDKRLVSVPDTHRFYVDRRHVGSLDLPHQDLYIQARPWVVDFLMAVAARVLPTPDSGYRLKLTSLVRTRQYQRRLRGRNRYAASGRKRSRWSPHLTGATVDISLRGMSPAIGQRLLAALDELAGVQAVDYLLERRNNCLHVFVRPDWRQRSPLYPNHVP